MLSDFLNDKSQYTDFRTRSWGAPILLFTRALTVHPQWWRKMNINLFRISVLYTVMIVLIFNSVFTAHLILDARFNFDIVYRKCHNLVCKITHFLHALGTSFICLNSDNKTVQGSLFIIKKVNGCNYFFFTLVIIAIKVELDSLKLV